MSVDQDNLPSGWTTATLDELIGCRGVFVDGDWVESKDQDPNGSVRLIQLADIGDGHFRDRSARFLTQEKAIELGCTFLEKGDLLIARMPDPLGRCCLFPLDRASAYVTVVDVCIVRVGSAPINPQYLMYSINSGAIRAQIAGHQSGSTRKRISRGNLATIKLPIAPRREQDRIVARIEELFSEVDNGAESLVTGQTQLEAYRQSLLKSAFDGKLTADWRARNSGRLETVGDLRMRLETEREAHHRKLLAAWEAKRAAGGRSGRVRPLESIGALAAEVTSTLPSLPVGWAWEKLAWMTCGVEYGTAAKSSKAGAVPVIRMGNLQNGRIDWDDLVFTDDAEEIAQYQLKPGDVLFNRTNSPELVGKTAIYKGERPALFAGYLIRINHNEKVVDGQYLTYFLNSHVARKYGNSVKTDGVNQSNINGEKLQGYPFPYCSLEEQHEIVRVLDEKLSAADELLNDLERQLARANALRQSILKKAFSGRLVAQDQSDEPASVLLERIRAERESADSGRKKKSNGKKEAA